jgi:hypothetical protein
MVTAGFWETLEGSDDVYIEGPTTVTEGACTLRTSRVATGGSSRTVVDAGVFRFEGTAACEDELSAGESQYICLAERDRPFFDVGTSGRVSFSAEGGALSPFSFELETPVAPTSVTAEPWTEGEDSIIRWTGGEGRVILGGGGYVGTDADGNLLNALLFCETDASAREITVPARLLTQYLEASASAPGDRPVSLSFIRYRVYEVDGKRLVASAKLVAAADVRDGT